jgi:hypothetical protein
MKGQMRWFASSTLFLATVIVFSQAQTVDMKVRIPFSFIAEDRTLPAGEYVITRIGGGKESMRLAQNDGSGLVTLLPTRVQARAWKDHGRLIFHKYGDRYFLSEVWRAKDAVGYKLHRSSAEGEIESSKDGSERVSVLALPERRR